MNAQIAAEIIDKWFDGIREDMPLLNVAPNDPTHVLRKNGLIESSTEFKQHRAAIASKAIDAFHQDARLVEGAIYLVYTRDAADRKICARYVGMASIHGKTNGAVSTLFLNREIRFASGLNTKGHIGMLNEALQAEQSKHPYANWVRELFLDNREGTQLREPVYVCMTLWRAGSESIVPALGHMSLEAEEMIRIDLLRQANKANGLLNKNANH
jgi:hypothetical protein